MVLDPRKQTVTKRRYFVRGMYVTCGILLCTAIALLVQIAASYDGKCGGFFPGLAAPRPCSFLEYVGGNFVLLVVILGTAYWPVLLALVFLPPLVGYLYDRRG